MKETYCMELYSIITSGRWMKELVDIKDHVRRLNSNYTLRGFEGVVEDVGHDNQKYKITIEPVGE